MSEQLAEILTPLILSLIFVRLYLVKSFTENVEDLYKVVAKVKAYLPQ